VGLVLSQVKQAVSSMDQGADVSIDMGDTFGALGVEVNFWVKPYYVGTGDATFVTFHDLIQLGIAFDGASYKAMKLTFNGVTSEKAFSASMSTWMNVNVRTKFFNYIRADFWEGDNWYQLEPTFQLKNNGLQAVIDYTVVFKDTISDVGVYWADVRIFELVDDIAWGPIFRHQVMDGGAPQDFERLLNYARIFGGNIYPDMADSSNTIPAVATINFDAIQCDEGLKIYSGSSCAACQTYGCLTC